MPQRSKKPIKTANKRAASAPAPSKRVAAKAPLKAAKRSAITKLELNSKPKPKRSTKPVQTARRAKAKVKAKANSPKPEPRKAPLKAVAKLKPRSPKREPRTMHALILPPKPKRLAARLLVARAPRAAHVEEVPPEAYL